MLSIYASAKNITDLSSTLQDELMQISKGVTENEMKLNIYKILWLKLCSEKGTQIKCFLQ